MAAYSNGSAAVANLSEVECDPSNSSTPCQFVKTHCIENGHRLLPFSYTEFAFCALGDDYKYLAVFLLVLWLMILFIGLAVTADDFLCPALVVITKTLKLSQNIAGVTFLAFGNGAPDIFASLAGIQQMKPDLVIGELFGGGIFVTTVVAGSIFLSQSFKVMERPFLRDLTFYLFAAFWAFYLFFVEQITLKHAIGFIALYIVYILTVVVSRFIYQRYKNSPAASQPADQAATEATPIPTIKVDPAPTEMEKSPVPSRRLNDNYVLDDPENEGVVLRRDLMTSSCPRPSDPQRRSDPPPRSGAGFSYRTSMAVPRKRAVSLSHKHHRESSIQQILKGMDLEKPCKSPDPDAPPCPPPLDPQVSKTSLASLLSQASDDLKMSPLQEFLYQAAPLDVDAWAEAPWYSRLLMILKSPVYLVLTLTVPVVDYENYKNNWCRWLNVIHCITVPLFLMAITHTLAIWPSGVPVGAVLSCGAVVLAVVVYFTSAHDAAPRYHPIFGYLGFAAAVAWIYCIANEIVAVIKTVGIVFHLSDVILGLTILAWGNSVGDFISNLSVARQGYPRMGISACYGGPLLNLLLGIGMPYTIQLARQGTQVMSLQFTWLVVLLFSTLCISLVSTLVTMTAFKFRVRRAYGGYLLVVYLLFIAFAILLETKTLPLVDISEPYHSF